MNMLQKEKEAQSRSKTKRGKSVEFDIKTQEVNNMTSCDEHFLCKKWGKGVRMKKPSQNHQRVGALMALAA